MSKSVDTAKKQQYGPITVRVCRKSVSTLETGRRSKHLVLIGEEAEKREKRRERNREGAKKLKEKRQQIEEELNQKIHQLENQLSNLTNRVDQLNERKQTLLYELNEELLNEIDDICSNEIQTKSCQSEQYSIDMDLFDDAFEEVINAHLQRCFSSN